MMKNESTKALKDIQLEFSSENDELIIALSTDGIEYIQSILGQPRDSEIDSHWHIDDFSGWLGGDIKHLVIMKTN